MDCQPPAWMEAWEAASGGALHNLCPPSPPIGLLGTFAGLAKPTLRHPAPRPHVLRTKGAFLSGR